MDLSIVVPIYNEVENLPLLTAATHAALDAQPLTWELILVDDGSTDGSTREMERLAREDPEHVRAVILRRNYGQSMGMAAGIDHARGDVIVLMDGDMQNDPADIPAMLEKLTDECDVVCGWRVRRQDAFVTRKLPSVLANRLIARVTGVTLHDWGCSLKAFRREIITGFRLYGEMHRFIPAYAAHVGARIVEMPVRHHPRRLGTSKYGLSRTARVLIDLCTVRLLTAYATKPGYFFGYMAMWLGGAGLVALLLTIILGITPATRVAAWPLLGMAGLLGLGSLQTFLLGMASEMLMRTYHESQGKLPYLVKRTVNIERDSHTVPACAE